MVMDEMGHTDPALARRLCRQSTRRGEDEKAALRAIVEGPSDDQGDAQMGTPGHSRDAEPTEQGGAGLAERGKIRSS
jgi:hypothetical protein